MSKDSTDVEHKSIVKTAKKPGRQDFGGPFRVSITAVGVFLLGQLFAVLIIGLIVGLVGGERALDQLAEGSVLSNLAIIFLTEAISVFLVYKLVGSNKAGLKKIGIVKPRFKDVPVALVGFLAFYAILLVVSVIVYTLIPSIDTDQKQDIGFENATATWELAAAFFSLVVLPPIAEEILMRGYFFTGLRQRLKFWPSAIIVSTLFGTAHLQLGNGETPLWAAALNTIVLSFVLVYLREKTGSLWPAIYVHAMNNAVAFGYLFKDTLF